MSFAAARLGIVADETLAASLRDGRLGEFEAVSPAAACLMPLLEALGWRGEPARVIEALPHFANELDVVDLRNCLAELGHPTRPLRLMRLGQLEPRLAPCLFVPRGGEPVVVLGEARGGFHVYDGRKKREIILSAWTPGTAYLPVAEAPVEREDGDFMARLGRRLRPLILQMFLATGLLDLLGFAVPLAGMAVYDGVIGTHDPGLLEPLALGLALVLVCDAALRLLRGRLTAYAAARVEFLLGVAALRTILGMPLMIAESAPVGTQLARLRQFDSVKEFVAGPLATVALELPFTLMMLAAIAFLAGPLVFVPIGFMAAFLGLVLLLMPLQRRFGAQASRTRAKRHAFLVEMLGSLDTVKECAGESAWLERYRDKSSRAAESNRKNQFLAVVAQTLGNTCMLAAGAATIGVGTLLVLDGSLTIGALVASMALVWRVLSPLQLGLTMLPRLEAALRSLHEINGLMRLVPAAAPRRAGATHRVFSGRLRLSRVSLRYRADDEPAVLGVDLDVRPGELVALIGPNGSGKSSLLKLAAGLYAPLAGTVTIDGLDLRQLDPTELRGAIAYLPQRPRLFFGTIAQNLRLAAPAASDEELEFALAEAGTLDEVRALPGGIRARIGDEGCKVLPAGLVQRLALASIYLRDCPVLLFDEPGQTLDEKGDADLMAMLARMKGKKTMILVTHRPSHLKLADRVVRLDGGRIASDGPARDLQRQLEARLK